MDITELLTFSVNQNASDCHLSAGIPPLIRIDGELKKIDCPALDVQLTTQMLQQVMTEQQRNYFAKHGEVDFSFEIADLARFRVNVFNQRRGPAGVFRIIPLQIPTLEELEIPAILNEIANFPNGLVLVTGPTGCGKSTTLAALINYLNETQHRHIITIEDPIEFIHESKNCLINQREINCHTASFQAALRSALREDPDVIFIGEMRDLESIRLALTAAETGHLVLASLHTSSAAQTINRLIDVFPGSEKNMVRSLLVNSLRAVITQTLVKKIPSGRMSAQEIMLCNAAIRNLIREDKINQIYSVIQTNTSVGMRTLDQRLHDLMDKQLISRQHAYDAAIYKEQFLE